MRVRFECEECGHQFSVGHVEYGVQYDCPRCAEMSTTTGHDYRTTYTVHGESEDCPSTSSTGKFPPIRAELSYGPITRKDLVAGIRVAACYYSSEKNEDAIAEYFIRVLAKLAGVKWHDQPPYDDLDWRKELLRLAWDE